VSGEPSAQPPIGASKPASPIEAAIDDVVRLTWDLTSAIAKLAYADAARTRSELERALSRAQAVASAISRISNRVMALDWVDELRAAAASELAIAPVRFEVHPIGLDGLRRRLYFVLEPANGPQPRTEPLAVPAEPPAARVEAVA
jgi:hypothetical protein